MKRLWLLGMAIAVSLWAKPFVWNRDGEYILGFYDMGLTTSATVYDVSYLSWQVLALRWNPFVKVFTFETTVRYFPMQHLALSWWIFSEKGVNPYLYTGLKVPHTFQAIGLPVGLGLVHQWTNWSLHFRVYGDFALVPVFVPVWSFELAAGFKW
ncbi:hypothetical protein BREVNS_0142 [Brevinematales bacterium NS]|nr:hypothetical protein [Brevinematales bacterium]QJR20892.1 hypothetical protein BREVNS_0142 [Brevinematales bacterium NS]